MVRANFKTRLPNFFHPMVFDKSSPILFFSGCKFMPKYGDELAAGKIKIAKNRSKKGSGFKTASDRLTKYCQV